jgi:hypothetical protein
VIHRRLEESKVSGLRFLHREDTRTVRWLTVKDEVVRLGSKFRKNSGQNSGSGPFSGIFGSGIAGIIFLGIAFFRTF